MFASARSDYEPSREIPMRLLLRMLKWLFCSFPFFFFLIRLPGFIMQEDQKTRKHQERKLGKDASAKNLAKDCQVSVLGETELASD